MPALLFPTTMLSLPNEHRWSTSLRKRRHPTLGDPSVAPPPSKRVRRSMQVLPEVEVKSDRTAHLQTQSWLLHLLPAEILDSIFGDLVLNERDHIALSGTCTLLRLGYTEEVWQTMIPTSNSPKGFRQSHFNFALLSDPCNLSQCLTIPVHSPTASTARSHIFSAALSRSSSAHAAGINVKAKCANPKHKRKKRCNCLRFVGPAHGKVVRGVNARSTPWGKIELKYQSLSTLIDPVQAGFRSAFPPGDRRWQKLNFQTRDYCFCLATVDAAIWNAAGGATGVKDVWARQVEAEARGEYQPFKWQECVKVQYGRCC
ncbi:hypothetical protein DL96DRAFT_1624322 [Flagelloscypha sp. PMI_526]|nr:hypothetical protein DL96DRAFT_1624322 [Flagelloscypha sp. PMI_526]